MLPARYDVSIYRPGWLPEPNLALPHQLALSDSKGLLEPGKYSSFNALSPRPGLLQRVFTRSRSKSPGRNEEAEIRGDLGLNTLSNPSDPQIEYVFIHGLGGGSSKTWCFKPDLSYFWIKEWLPHHPGFRNVRIHSFGYNSDWTQRGNSSLDIPDFGQALLGSIRNSDSFSQVRFVLFSSLLFISSMPMPMLTTRHLEPHSVCWAQYGWPCCERGSCSISLVYYSVQVPTFAC